MRVDRMAVATGYDVEAAAAGWRMPFGPHLGELIVDVPTDHLIALLAEPFVPVVDDDGEPLDIPPDWLSPHGGAMGKIRRCRCFGLVCDLVRLRDPDAYDGLLGDPGTDGLPDDEGGGEDDVAVAEPDPRPGPPKRKRTRATRGKAT